MDWWEKMKIKHTLAWNVGSGPSLCCNTLVQALLLVCMCFEHQIRSRVVKETLCWDWDILHTKWLPWTRYEQPWRLTGEFPSPAGLSGKLWLSGSCSTIKSNRKTTANKLAPTQSFRHQTKTKPPDAWIDPIELSHAPWSQMPPNHHMYVWNSKQHIFKQALASLFWSFAIYKYCRNIPK